MLAFAWEVTYVIEFQKMDQNHSYLVMFYAAT